MPLDMVNLTVSCIAYRLYDLQNVWSADCFITSYQSILADPKKVFEPYPKPKNSSLGPQKVKNDPKIKSKSNVRI